MNSESRIEASVSTDQTERIGGNVPGVTSAQSANAVPPTATPGFDDLSKKRRERIEKMKEKLQREIARGQRCHPQGTERPTLRLGNDGRGRIPRRKH